MSRDGGLLTLVDESTAGPGADVLRAVLTERGRVVNFYRMMANSPAIARPVFELVWALWHDTHLDRADVELIILRVARTTGSEYEWVSHAPLARAAGVTDDQLRTLSDQADPRTDPAFEDRQRAMLTVVDEVTTGIVSPAASVTGFTDAFSEAERVEIMTIAGLYRGIAAMLRSFDVPLDDAGPER